MSVLASPSFFAERARAIGFSTEQIVLLVGAGWSTVGKFAFATAQAPGIGEDTALVRDVVTPIFGANTTPALIAMVRNLYFESYTYAASDMRSRVERTDEDPPRRMPRVERETRVEAVRDRIGKSTISEERIPASSVVDFLNACAEDGNLKYLPWAKTISARLETAGGSKTSANLEWKADKHGAVKERKVVDSVSQEVGHDLLKLEHVMIRRAVGMEAARLLSYEAAMEAPHAWFESLEDEPADPELYCKTTIAQVAKADLELFQIVARKCRTGIMQLASGAYPMEVHWRAALASSRIMQILLPLGKVVTPQPAVRHQPPQQQPKPQQHVAVQQPAWDKKSKNQKKAAKAAGKKGSGKAGKAKGLGPRPQGLHHCASHTDQGEPICFGYNLGTCSASAVPAGGKCPKGLHVCAIPGCFTANHHQGTHA